MTFNLLWHLGAVSFWSFLISLALVVLFGALVWIGIKGFKPGASLSPLGIIVGLITVVLLMIQFVPAVAAHNLKGNINEASNFANLLIFSELLNGGGYRQSCP